MTVRKERREGIQDIRRLHDLVFAGPVEGTIVDAIREKGIDEREKGGCFLVVVLGHAAYYRKLGFAPAGRYGLACRWEGIPDDVFMVRFLK